MSFALLAVLLSLVTAAGVVVAMRSGRASLCGSAASVLDGGARTGTAHR
jgi:hypothetical protein